METNYYDKKCIIRTESAGVFFATLKEFDATNSIATLADCRRLWYWKGAASLSQLATEGVKSPVGCRFTVIVPQMQVMQVIEIIPCSKEAVKSIKSVPVWRIN